MTQPNSEVLEHTGTPSAVPTALQASCDHTFNPKCAHNLMETKCNQPQYLIPLNKICAHIPSGSQNNQVSLSNSLASPYPPDPGEHVLKRSATATGEQDFPVKWFKFIHPSPKPRMTETLVQKPVHVAYSPIASMNYQWTINLHDGYPLLQGTQPEEYIPPTLHTLSNHKPTMFHLGDDYLCTTRILLPPGDNGENLEAATNEETKISDDLYKLKALIGHQGPLKALGPNWKEFQYNVLIEWETGEKTYEPLSVLAAYNSFTWASYTKVNGISHLDGWKRMMNLAKRDKHDLTCIASPKGVMKSTFSWTNLFKSSTSSTLSLGEPTLGKFNQVKLLCSSTSSTLCDPTLAKLNQETEFCITIHITFDDSVVHTGTTFSLPSSSSETSRVSDCQSNLVTTPCSTRILDKLMIEVTKDPIHPVGKNGEHIIKSKPTHGFIGYWPNWK